MVRTALALAAVSVLALASACHEDRDEKVGVTQTTSADVPTTEPTPAAGVAAPPPIRPPAAPRPGVSRAPVPWTSADAPPPDPSAADFAREPLEDPGPPVTVPSPRYRR